MPAPAGKNYQIPALHTRKKIVKKLTLAMLGFFGLGVFATPVAATIMTSQSPIPIAYPTPTNPSSEIKDDVSWKQCISDDSNPLDICPKPMCFIGPNGEWVCI